MMRPVEPYVASFASPPQGPEAELPVSQLAALGVPVPAGFLILEPPGGASDGREPESRRFVRSIDQALVLLERRTGLRLGDPCAPLFVRLVDSSDPSRPGSELPLGLAPATLDGLIRRTGQPRHALECLRRLIAHIGCHAHGLEAGLFQRLLEDEQARQGGPSDDGQAGVSAEVLRELVARSLDLFELRTARPFPADPRRQLLLAVGGLWKRSSGRQPAPLLVQAMVFGNSGGRSGAGVLCTRDPASGADRPQIDFLVNAEPCDLQSGRRPVSWGPELSRRLPGVSEQLERACPGLEQTFGDMVEAQFVVEDGQLWFLWAGAAQRSARASLRVALELVSAGRLSRPAALKLLDRVPPEQLNAEQVRDHELVEPLLVAVPTSPGAATGRLAISCEQARRFHQAGHAVILLHEQGVHSDRFGLALARGVLLLGGGRNSKAALMARRLGLPCVLIRDSLVMDRHAAVIRIGSEVLREGDSVTIDGHTGRIYAGSLPVEPASDPDELPQLRRWIHDAGLMNHPLG